MKVIAVDDEKAALNDIKHQIEKIPDVDYMGGFTDPIEAVRWLSENHVDVAFLDINMHIMDGLTLAKHVRVTDPDCMVIFLTAYSEYAVDAFRLKVYGYLVKPATVEDIEYELGQLKKLDKFLKKSYICVQCFGNFEVFADDKPLHFSRAKSKELFAYLIDRRGAGITNAEIAAVLFEDKPYDLSIKSQVRNIIADMRKTFREANAENIIHNNRNNLAVNPAAISCDYYDFLKGHVFSINSFMGEYMTNYGWAEFTLGKLMNSDT